MNYQIQIGGQPDLWMNNFTHGFGEKIMKIKLGLLAVTMTVVTHTSYAAELSVVGSWSGLPLHKLYEKPFWDEKMPAASDGKITAACSMLA